jgi:hypothetical protein
MSSKMPPVPPQNRSPKGTGEGDHARTAGRGDRPEAPKNSEKTGQPANTKVNTTHQGHQQDR